MTKYVTDEEVAEVARAAISRYLTTEEVAEVARTSPETVRYWRQVGRGPASFRLGRRVLYAEDDVAAWIEQARSTDPHH